MISLIVVFHCMFLLSTSKFQHLWLRALYATRTCLKVSLWFYCRCGRGNHMRARLAQQACQCFKRPASVIKLLSSLFVSHFTIPSSHLSRLISHFSFFIGHVSFLSSHLTFLFSHCSFSYSTLHICRVPFLIPHFSFHISHFSLFMSHFTFHIFHASFLISHFACILSHFTFLSSHFSTISYFSFAQSLDFCLWLSWQFSDIGRTFV